MPAMVFASHARNPCELRESSMPVEAPREQRVCIRSAPASGEQAGRPRLLPKLANARRMDVGDTFVEYREMFRKAGFRRTSLYPLPAMRTGVDLRKMSQR